MIQNSVCTVVVIGTASGLILVIQNSVRMTGIVSGLIVATVTASGLELGTGTVSGTQLQNSETASRFELCFILVSSRLVKA